MEKYFKKITSYILLVIMILTSLAVPLALKGNYFHGLSILGEHKQQDVNIEEVGNDSILLDNETITTMVSLPDDKVFFGGTNGAWAIETIVDGIPEGDISNGKFSFGENPQSITYVVKQYDYDPSERANIIIGFDSGSIGIFNTETSNFYSTDEYGWKISSGIVKIIDLGRGEEYLFIDKTGEVIKVNTKDKTHDSWGQIDSLGGNNITATYTLSDGRILIGTDESGGENTTTLVAYNFWTNETELFFNDFVFPDHRKSTIRAIEYLYAGDYVLCFDNGEYGIVNLNRRLIFHSGFGNWGAGENEQINVILKLNDLENTEVILGGTNGFWRIIDLSPNKGQEHVIKEGQLTNKQTISSLYDSGGNDLSTILLGQDNGEWTTIRPLNSNIAFDKTIFPTPIEQEGNKLTYKIFTKTDYPDWPINVKKYKIQSILFNEKTKKDIISKTPLLDTFGEMNVEISSEDIVYSNYYTDLRVQLFDEDGTTPIGETWDTGVDFETPDGKINDITLATLGDVNSNGFDFTIDTFDFEGDNPDKIKPYTVSVLAKVDGGETETIWTSIFKYSATDGEKFIVDNLNPGVEYTDVVLQLKDKESGDVIGTQFNLSDSIKTTNLPISLTGEITEKTKDSFKIKADVEAEDSSKKISNGYYLNASSDDFESSKIYHSSKMDDAGNDIEFNIEGLDPGQVYNNVKIWLSWDEEGKEEIPNCSSVIGGVYLENHVQKISTASIDEKETTSNTLTINANVTADNESLNVTTPFTIQVIDTMGGTSKVIYETTSLKTAGKLSPIVVTNLSTKTKYNLKLKLLENGEQVGELFDIGEVSTHSSSVIGINSILVQKTTITSESFDIVADIDSKYGAKEVESYKLKLFANGDDTNPVWTGESSSAGAGQRFTVDGLSSSTSYENIIYKIYEGDKEEVIDSMSGDDVVTLGKVTGFDPDNVRVSNIKDKSFNVSMDINDTFEIDSNGPPHQVEDFKISIFANGDDENSIWTSNIFYGFSGPITFNVDNLNTSTNYSNIKIQFIDKDGTPFGDDPLPMEMGINVKTKFSYVLETSIISGSILFLIVLFFVISITIILVKKGRERAKERTIGNLKRF